jgi:hypothetical protein
VPIQVNPALPEILSRTLKYSAGISATNQATASVTAAQGTGETGSGTYVAGNVVGSGTGNAQANVGAQTNVLGLINRM